MITPKPWRYEPETKTIRSVPTNYWLATMDSWDGAVDHAANAQLIAAAPELLEALKAVLADTHSPVDGDQYTIRELLHTDKLSIAEAAIAKAEGR